MGGLGAVRTVNAVHLNFADQDAARLYTNSTANQLFVRQYAGCYRYLLEYSVNGETWFTIADRSDYVSDTYNDSGQTIGTKIISLNQG